MSGEDLFGWSFGILFVACVVGGLSVVVHSFLRMPWERPVHTGSRWLLHGAGPVAVIAVARASPYCDTRIQWQRFDGTKGVAVVRDFTASAKLLTASEYAVIVARENLELELDKDGGAA